MSRSQLITDLDALLARAGSETAILAVLVVDLDRFGTINDSFGTAAGSQLVETVRGRLGAVLRSSDILARIADDGFVVITENIGDAAEALRLGTRLGTAVAKPTSIGGTEIVVTACAGVATTAGSGRDAEALLRDAEAAMHQAKGQGGARCVLFDQAVRNQVVARMELEQELRHGLDDAEFDVHYQPILTVAEQTPVGAEALVRWQHPTRGLLAPQEFLTVAQAAGLIDRLGHHVLRTACAGAAAFPQVDGRTPLGVSVNLSASELADPGLVHRVQRTLASTGLAPDRLTLEITEAAVMKDPFATARTVRRLRDLGVRIAADDFGTGYWSFSYLLQFRVDTIKIDRSFVAGMAEDRDHISIVRAIIGLAHELDMTIVAEGVETPEERDRLEWLDCDLAQGYLWSPALRHEDFQRWVGPRRGAGGG